VSILSLVEINYKAAGTGPVAVRFHFHIVLQAFLYRELAPALDPELSAFLTSVTEQDHRLPRPPEQTYRNQHISQAGMSIAVSLTSRRRTSLGGVNLQEQQLIARQKAGLRSGILQQERHKTY